MSPSNNKDKPTMMISLSMITIPFFLPYSKKAPNPKRASPLLKPMKSNQSQNLPKLKEKLGKPKINLNSFSIKMLQNLPISGKMILKKHKLKKSIILKTLKRKFMSLSMSMRKMDSKTIQDKAQLRNQSENNSQPHQVLQSSNQSEKILGIHQTGSKEKAKS